MITTLLVLIYLIFHFFRAINCENDDEILYKRKWSELYYRKCFDLWNKSVYNFDSNNIISHPFIISEKEDMSLVAEIYFKEKPTNERQRIHVKVDFTDGSSLENEADVIIK